MYSHRQNKLFAFIGMCGGLLCSVADYLLEYLGRASTTLGSWGVTESAWADMSAWRFTASIWIVSLAVPMYMLGLIAVMRQMTSTHKKLGTAYGISAVLGSLGALFIHIILCVMPVVYKFVLSKTDLDTAVATVDNMTPSFIGPFYIYYTLLVIIPIVLFCVYCCKKGSLYRGWYAGLIVIFTLVCIVVSKLVPCLEWIGVGAISRMIAMLGFVAWRTECKKGD